MKKKLIICLLIGIILLSGCFSSYHDSSTVDKSLSNMVNYIVDNSSFDIIVSAHDGRQDEISCIRLGIVVDAEEADEQYVIINSVIKAVDEYLINCDDIDGSAQELIATFVLPIDRYSGVPGETLCEVTNRSANNSYESELVSITPMTYGFVNDYENRNSVFRIPSEDFTGIHIMSIEQAPDAVIRGYLDAWSAIDTVYVSTTEQANDLQVSYPDVIFISYE